MALDPYELAVRQQLGLSSSEPAPDEGWDLAQPIRTFFGATQGVVPKLASGLFPKQYAAAEEERKREMGITEATPWYEQAEALPGAGDVAAQFIPEGVKESLPGRIVGPVARLVGNIAGDPTTYTPAVLGKAAGLLAKGTRGAEVLAETARAVPAALELGGETLAQATKATRVQEVAKAIAESSPLRAKAYQAAEVMAESLPTAMGGAAAVGYGPSVIRGAWEGAKETKQALGEGDYEQALVSGANTALMAGLGTLMARGVMDVTKARSILSKELADQALIPADERFIGPTLPLGRSGLAEPTLQAAEEIGPLKRATRPLGWVEGPGFESVPGIPRRPVETPPMPEGPNQKLADDAILEYRIQQEKEKARAQFLADQAREQPVMHQIAPGIEPRPIPRAEPAPRARRGGKQLPLELGPGEKVLTRGERAKAEAAALEAKVTEALADPDVPGLVEERARALMLQDLQEKARGKNTKGLAEDRKLFEAADTNDPKYLDWLNRTKAVATAELATKFRRMAKGGLDPVEQLREARVDREERLGMAGELPPEEAAPTPENLPPEGQISTPARFKKRVADAESAIARRRSEIETELDTIAGRASGDPYNPANLTPKDARRWRELHDELRQVEKAEDLSRGAAQPTPEPAPAVPAEGPTTPPVVREAAPAAPEPVAPAAEAPAPTAISETPAVTEGTHRAATPEERMGRTPEEWTDSVLSEKNERRPEIRAAFEKDPELRAELSRRIREYQDQARKEQEAAGKEYTEAKARAAAYKAKSQLVSDRKLDVKKAEFPTPKVESAVVKAEAPEVPRQEPLAGGPAEPGSQLGEIAAGKVVAEKGARGAGAATVGFVRTTTEGPGKRVGKTKSGLSPEAERWHETVWPVVRETTPIERVLQTFRERDGGRGLLLREADNLRLNDKRVEEFTQFQKLYDQQRAQGAAAGVARAAAIKALGGGQHLRNMIGLVEKALGRETIQAAAEAQGAPRALPVEKGGAPKPVLEAAAEAKKSVDARLRDFAGQVIRGEELNAAAVGDVLRQYAGILGARKGARLGRGALAKALSDEDLHNFGKAILGDAYPRKARPGADRILRLLAEKFGIDPKELEAAVPEPAVKALPKEPPFEPPARNVEGVVPLRRGPNGSRTLFEKDGATPGRWVATFGHEDAPAVELDALKKDIGELLGDDRVNQIVIGKDLKPKGPIGKYLAGLREYVDGLQAEGKVNWENRPDGSLFLQKVYHSAGMETRNLLDVAGHDWTKHVDFNDITVGLQGNADDARMLADHMAEPVDAWKTVEPVAKALGLDVKASDPVTPLNREGWFHQVYLLNGKDKSGQQYVMRIGKSPYLELPRPDQRALVNTPVKTGEFKAVTGERFTYSVHPYAWSPGVEMHFGSMFNRDELIRKFHGYYDSMTVPSRRYEQQLLERLQGRLPDGIGLGDYLNDAAKLNEEISRTGLVDGDIYFNQQVWRSDQTGYVKLKPGEAPSGIVRVAPDGSRYKLVLLDLGSVRPLESKGQWGEIHPSMRVALKTADESLPLSARRMVEEGLRQDSVDAVDLGNGLKIANHHGVFGPGYVALAGKYGREAVVGMKRIFDDLVEELKPKTKVEFAGLTTSPYLSGFYQEGPGGAKVFGNLVEAVHASRSYDDAVDKIAHTLSHEIAHLAGESHDSPMFADLSQHIENLTKAEGWHEAAKTKLKDSGFTEEVYDKIKEDLVGQFHDAWREINGRDWRGSEETGAPAVEGVPARATTGSVAAKSNLAGGGAEAPPGGGGAGLRPGGSVPGGGERAAGGVRPGAAAGGRHAEGPAEGREVGSLAREGSDPTEAFIAGLESRDQGEPVTYDLAKRELNELVKAKTIPITHAVRAAMDVATTLSKELPDSEIQQWAKSAPDPRGRPGVVQGAVNLLYDIPGVSDRGKARVALFANLLDDAGLLARSKVRSWDMVEAEVRDLLGMTTPEEYIKAFRNKGGGITDTEHMALVTVRDELTRKADYIEKQFVKAAEEGDIPAAEKLFKDLRVADGNEAAAIALVTNKLTGAARALAVGRHQRIQLDPQAAFRADLRAGILERLQTRTKDKAEAGRQADELVAKFYEILGKRGDWNEFRKALNLAMGRTGMRGAFSKVLEFYKAGLLGWPSEVANITSNTMFRASRYGEDTIAGLLDAGAYKLGKLTGGILGTKERSVFLGEAGIGLDALRDAAVEGWGPLWKAEGKLLRLEGGDMATMMKQGALAQDMMTAGGAIGGKLGNLIRMHFDSMQNWDTFAKHLARTDSMYRDIYRGLRKGEKWLEARKRPGESLRESTRRIAREIRENQSRMQQGLDFDGTLIHQSKEIMKRADEFADKDTFQAGLGNAGRGVQSFLREHPALQFLVPFYRTPTNIFKETLDRTPLGFAKAAVKWKGMSQAERMQALSKPAMGSAILATFASLAANGEITGGGPLSFEEREALQATGWQPYSVRVGDQWVSYQRLEPLASLMGMAADSIEAAREGDMDTFSGGMQKLADSVAENLTNKTFLSGLSSLTGAISDPKRELGSFVKQMQGSVIPNSIGFVPFGHLARAIDPVYREAEPMTWDAFTTKIPFASQSLSPAYGPTGEVRMRTGTAIERAASPFARRTVEEGPKSRGSEEMVRMRAVPKAPMRYWTSPQGFRVPLKPEERQKLAKALEEATVLIGQRIVKDPGYQRLPKDEMDPQYQYGQKTKQELLEKLIGKYRARALKQIMPALKQRSRQMYRDREL